MKKLLFFATAWFLATCVAHSQNSTNALLSLFGSLPSQMNNEEIIRLKDGNNRISYVYYKTLGVISDDHEVFPIGKAQVGQTVHMFYADVKYGTDNNPNNYLIDISSIAIDAETGAMISKEASFYLGMVGKDALTRSTTFNVNNNIITFTITSINDEGKQHSETTSYKMTSKGLEFVN